MVAGAKKWWLLDDKELGGSSGVKVKVTVKSVCSVGRVE